MDLLIDHIPGETRIAQVQDDALHRLDIWRDDQATGERAEEGSLYKGRVIKVVPSLQAAFVDISSGPSGYLPVKGTFGEDISKSLHEGELITVQVRRPAHDDKGPMLSQRLEINGTYMVLTPYRKGLNISRKISDHKERERLHDILNAQHDDTLGLVVRTHSANVSTEDLLADHDSVMSQWRICQENQATAPTRLSPLPSLWDRLATCFKSEDYDNIIIQTVEGHAKARQTYRDATFQDFSAPLFETNGLEDDIHALAQNRVDLQGGGHITIEPTKALIAIDVDSDGRTDSKNLDDNALRLNEAAFLRALDQIVKRNLCGQILIDFVTLKSKQSRDLLTQAIQRHTKNTTLTFHGLTRLGLGEFSRARQGADLMAQLKAPATTFHKMLRDLAGTQVAPDHHLHMASDLYTQWHNRPPHWLTKRHGHALKAHHAPHLKSGQYELSTAKETHNAV